jgi:hypothetical protein
VNSHSVLYVSRRAECTKRNARIAGDRKCVDVVEAELRINVRWENLQDGKQDQADSGQRQRLGMTTQAKVVGQTLLALISC